MAKIQPKLNTQDFAEKLATYLISEELFGRHAATKKEMESKTPTPKSIYESIEEYNKYIDDVNAWSEEADKWNDMYSLLYSEKQAAESSLIKLLPKNTWIKTTWEDQLIWVGYCTSNWGGGTAALQVSFSEPKKMLSHTDYQ